MKKAVYISSAIIFVGLVIIASQIATQGTTQQKELDLQNNQVARVTSNQQELAKCFASADKAWQDALNTAAAKNSALPQDSYYSYMQATTQVRLAQVTECQAEYPLN